MKKDLEDWKRRNPRTCRKTRFSSHSRMSDEFGHRIFVSDYQPERNWQSRNVIYARRTPSHILSQYHTQGSLQMYITKGHIAGCERANYVLGWLCILTHSCTRIHITDINPHTHTETESKHKHIYRLEIHLATNRKASPRRSIITSRVADAVYIRVRYTCIKKSMLISS